MLRLRHAQEAAYCERILAKSGLTVLTATLPRDAVPTHWTHYPERDIYDADTGAQWYYHSHAGEASGDAQGEHGHFHCFVRPAGKEGPVHHLVAVAVDAMGRLTRLFTVPRRIVDDSDLPVDERISLLAKFDVQLDAPSYLVNRWLTAIVGLYQEDIGDLIREGAQRAASEPTLDVTAERHVSLTETLKQLSER